MSRASWLIDPSRIATKIRSASSALDPGKVDWKSNPSKSCPNCQHVIDNSDVVHEWPGLPRGVKFDPSDQEIIWHLLAKAGFENLKPHPFIDEFIPTVQEDDGICYTHPQNLPGVRQDGSVSHFFHRAIKAYNTGTRKRRKINGDNLGDLRWHKTGRTKPVSLDGIQKGCKKIMVLYESNVRGGKSEKTNWVMHQYHLGTSEDEMEGQYVVSKVFYQQQQIIRQIDIAEEDVSENGGVGILDTAIPKVDPVTPKLAVPEPRAERGGGSSFVDLVQDLDSSTLLGEQHNNVSLTMRDTLETPSDQSDDQPQMVAMESDKNCDDDGDKADDVDGKWWEDSEFLLNSQQLLEGISLCDEFLQSQSPTRGEHGNSQGSKEGKALLSDYAHLGSEDLKRDLEACQNSVVDPANIELDTPPDFRLSQLEFESQDSYIAWGGSARGGKGD